MSLNAWSSSSLLVLFAGSAVVGVYVLSSIEGIILSNGDFLVGMIAGPLSLLAGILTFWFGFKSVVENGSMV